MLDDLSNQGLRKSLLGEVDVFQFDATHELYAHMNINYVRLDRLPDFDNYHDVLEPFAAGAYFTTTGEVLLPEWTIAPASGDEIAVSADVRWTFPLRFAEIVWGDGEKTRSFPYIDDCLPGLPLLTGSDDLPEPLNLGSSEMVTINQLVAFVEDIAGVQLERESKLDAPKGVAGRNSDNTFIKEVLGWEPSTPFKEGLTKTYHWIEKQYNDRKAGKRTVS